MRPKCAVAVCLALAVIAPAAAADPVFERDVLPILQSHCLQCHGGLQQKGKLDLRTMAGIHAGGRQGKAVTPGKPDESLLWTLVASDKMPPKPIKVSAEQKQVVEIWIKTGAKAAPRNLAVTIPPQARGAAELAALIDEHADQALADAKVPASPSAGDGEFLRRVYLDVVGRIPSRAEAQAFLDDKEPKKRAHVIDKLLADPAYGHYWARQWRDRVAVPVAAGEDLGGRHSQAFHQWLAEEFNKNRPWDEIVRTIIAAEGEAAPVAFVRQCMDDGQPRAAKLAASVSRRFLGVQLQCAECHDHPFTTWKQDDFWGLAAFFSRTASVGKTRTEMRVGIYDTASGPPKTRFGLKPLERKDGGAVVLPEDAGPRAGTVVGAKFLAGKSVELDGTAPARPVLADWVTARDNPFFARAAVNRLWAQLFGVGLVDPVDSLDADNLPSHPELFDALAGELVASGYDLKQMLKGMLLSRAYQRTHQALPGNKHDRRLLSHATIKVVPPETFFDCLVSASGGDLSKPNAALATTGRPLRGSPFAGRGEFLKLFATASIDGAAADYTHGIPQTLALLNDALTNNPTRLVDQLAREKGDAETTVAQIYLAVLSRRPSAEESKLIQEFLQRQPAGAGAYQAVWWALVNSPEFAVIP